MRIVLDELRVASQGKFAPGLLKRVSSIRFSEERYDVACVSVNRPANTAPKLQFGIQLCTPALAGDTVMLHYYCIFITATRSPTAVYKTPTFDSEAPSCSMRRASINRSRPR